MGVPLRRGRELTASDVATSSPVVVINQKLAEVIWPGQDPLGKHVNIFGDKQSEVVGIVGNVLHNGLSEPAGAKSYLAFSQNPWFYVAPAIRTHGDQAVFGALALVLSFVGIYGTYLVIAALLALAASAACYVPARRALAVDPLVALRYE